jgi:hypothetical protein
MSTSPVAVPSLDCLGAWFGAEVPAAGEPLSATPVAGGKSKSTRTRWRGQSSAARPEGEVPHAAR